jgi:prevent-host-death family protein
MRKVINAKTLRRELGEILRRVRKGERFTLVYRSRPVGQLVPLEERGFVAEDLEDDPLYRAGPVGRSTDGKTSASHDEFLYGSTAR